MSRLIGSNGKNGTSNFTNASEWAWHVESRAWYAEVTGYTATTVHVHFGPLPACSKFTNAGRVSTTYKATLSPILGHMGACPRAAQLHACSSPILGHIGACPTEPS